MIDPQRRLVSVITAVAPSRAQFLARAWASLAAQSPTESWSWEWLVQSDGPGADLASSIVALTARDERCRFESTAKPQGAAAARDHALKRAYGELVVTLDADDEFEPRALDFLISALARDPSLGWVAGRTVYLRGDGSIDPYPDRLPTGPVALGWFADDWLTHDHPAACPGSFAIRTELVSAVGGWMALKGSEDTGMLVAISECQPGYGINEVVYRYRKWDGQTTASPDWRAAKPQHYEAIARRITAIRASRQDGSA